jgi:protein SCO1/2
MTLSDRVRRLAVPLAAFVLGLVVLGVALVLTVSPRSPGASAITGTFSLIDHDGRRVTEKDFQGKPYLVFVGFTHCPDVCPTTLFQMSEVLRATGEKGRDLRALFISVDPERDKPEVLKSYLASFDERIRGLTGDPAAVEAALKSFRGYARKVPLQGGDYTMEHSAFVYLMDEDGRFVSTFNLNRPPEEAARDFLKQV